jgi:hypothetical protein
MNSQERYTPNALAVLSEVAEGLAALLLNGQTRTIFLNKMPLNQVDRMFISDVLGRGTTVITSKGGAQPAEWVESGIPGIWLGVYFDSKGGPMLETLEISHFPTLAAVQPEDITLGIQQLQDRMQLLAAEAG